MKNNEIWKEIIGFERYYKISNYGNVVSIRTGKLLKLELTRGGYNRVQLNVNSNHKRFLVHRLVALHFLDKIEGKNEVNHINNIRNDNRLENLEWCTSKENQEHCINQGRKVIHAGSKNAMSKLTESEVIEIRRLKSTGIKNIQIAKLFNLDEKHVSLIVLRKRWKHI